MKFKQLILLSTLLIPFLTSRAELLSRVFETAQLFHGSQVIKQSAAENIMAKNGWHYDFKDFHMCVLSDHLNDATLNETQHEIRSLLAVIPEHYKLIEAFSSFNVFSVFAEPTTDEGIMDVLIYNQANYYGRRVIFFGQMTRSNLMLLDAGDVNMGYFGTSIKPMPERYFQSYVTIQREENQLNEGLKTHHISAEEWRQEKATLQTKIQELQELVKVSE